MQLSDDQYLLALASLEVIGYRRLLDLKKLYGSYKNIWNSDPHDWTFMQPQTREKSIQIKNTISLDNLQQTLESKHISYITIDDARYPALLKEIASPPIVLFYQGNIHLLQSRCLGVVGSRNPTGYALQAIKYLFPDLLRANLTIVSGFQRGVDTLAHTQALEHNGNTIAVFGCGLDIPYPPQNKMLKQKFLETDNLLISEYPPGTAPLAYKFPQRNRIISGMSLGVLIVEAKEKSGSMITATFANEQNREVFAIPGSITSPYSTGPHVLIQQGAQLVYRASHILDVLTIPLPPATSVHVEMSANMTPTQQQILTVLEYTEKHIDDIIKTTQLEPTEVLAEIALLELQGYIVSVGDGRYIMLEK